MLYTIRVYTCRLKTNDNSLVGLYNFKTVSK